jgi:hypothetical protein
MDYLLVVIINDLYHYNRQIKRDKKTLMFEQTFKNIDDSTKMRVVVAN